MKKLLLIVAVGVAGLMSANGRVVSSNFSNDAESIFETKELKSENSMFVSKSMNTSASSVNALSVQGVKCFDEINGTIVEVKCPPIIIIVDEPGE